MINLDLYERDILMTGFAQPEILSRILLCGCMQEIAVENRSFTISVQDGRFSVTLSEPHPTITTTTMPKTCELCTRPSCRVRSSDPMRVIHKHLDFDTGTLTSHFLTLFNAEAKRDRTISEVSSLQCW